MRALAWLLPLLVAAPACDDFSAFSATATIPLDAGLSADGEPAAPADLAPSPWHDEQSGSGADLFGVWGSGADDLWAAGTGGVVLHRTSGAWTKVASPVNETLRAVWGTGPSGVWMAGDGGRAVSWNGSKLTPEQTIEKTAIYGGSGDLMAGAEGNLYVRELGVVWARIVYRAPVTLSAAWSDGVARFAVGKGGQIVSVNSQLGGSSEPNKSTADLSGVAGERTEVIAVGAGGVVLRREFSSNASWNPQSSPAKEDLRAVAACGNGRYVAAGAKGAVITSGDHGKSWSRLAAPSDTTLNGVWCTGPGSVWVVGNNGYIARLGN